MTHDMRPAVAILSADLMLSVRLEDVITAQSGRPLAADTPEALVAAVDAHFPVLALVDLATPGDIPDAIRRCKLRPHTRHTPIYAFGSHVNIAALQAARQAGADHAWARSKMMEQLAEVVGSHIRPPLRYPDGWDGQLSDLARQGLAEFNRGDFFEQHEFLEHAWLAETRPIRDMYQGILQVGLAFLQMEQGNWAGAVKMFRRGLPRLRGLPDVCQGVNIAKFRQESECIHADITAAGEQGLAAFDVSRFPQIEYTN